MTPASEAQMNTYGNNLDLHLFQTYSQLPSGSYRRMFPDASQFDDWLTACAMRQQELFGIDVEQLEGDELADFLTWTAYAILDEVHEMMRCVSWKPWSTGER